MLPANLIIINYHKIEHKSDFGITSRKPADFCNDLDELIENGYVTVTFQDLNDDAKIASKPVIITFDDAYLSFYDSAYKNLLQRNMKAVVFVPVNYIGMRNKWDVQFFGKSYFHMNEDQIKEISQNNIEIGSHTLNHRYLNTLNDEELERELKESKSKLEKIVNKPVLSISYPFGKYNKRVLKYAKKYYKYGVQQINNSFKESEFRDFTLQRINIYKTDSRKSFRTKLNYLHNRVVRIQNRAVQLGSWATIIQQLIKNNVN